MKQQLRILQDTDAFNPRTDYDQFGTLFIAENRYFTGDEGATDPEYLNEDEAFIILPVFHYTHSGTVLNTTGFSCPWDSGQCGFTYVSKKDFLREWSRDNVFTRWRAENLLRSEVDTYSHYLSGNVWGFQIVEESTCDQGHVHEDILDSCWGFYGSSDPKENGMSCHLEHDLSEYEVVQ